MSPANNMDKKNEESDLNKFVETLQNMIIEEERSIYSQKVIELANNPQNLARIDDADAHAKVTGWCGDTMEIFIKCVEDTIGDITFMTDGCGATLATGSMLTIMAKGKRLEEARNISEEDLLDALDGLPDENLHCANLGVTTLRKAVEDLLSKGDKEHLRLEEKEEQISKERKEGS